MAPTSFLLSNNDEETERRSSFISSAITRAGSFIGAKLGGPIGSFIGGAIGGLIGSFGGFGSKGRSRAQRARDNLIADINTTNIMNQFNQSRATEAVSSGETLAVVEGDARFHLNSQQFTQGITLPITAGGQGFLDITNRSAPELVKGLTGEMIDRDRRFLHTIQTSGLGASFIKRALIGSGQTEKAAEFESIVTGEKRSFFFDPKLPNTIDENLNFLQAGPNQFQSGGRIEIFENTLGITQESLKEPVSENPQAAQTSSGQTQLVGSADTSRRSRLLALKERGGVSRQRLLA